MISIHFPFLVLSSHLLTRMKPIRSRSPIQDRVGSSSFCPSSHENTAAYGVVAQSHTIPQSPQLFSCNIASPHLPSLKEAECQEQLQLFLFTVCVYLANPPVPSSAFPPETVYASRPVPLAGEEEHTLFLLLQRLTELLLALTLNSLRSEVTGRSAGATPVERVWWSRSKQSFVKLSSTWTRRTPQGGHGSLR